MNEYIVSEEIASNIKEILQIVKSLKQNSSGNTNTPPKQNNANSGDKKKPQDIIGVLELFEMNKNGNYKIIIDSNGAKTELFLSQNKTKVIDYVNSYGMLGKQVKATCFKNVSPHGNHEYLSCVHIAVEKNQQQQTCEEIGVDNDDVPF